jgi:hypothetical protein
MNFKSLLAALAVCACASALAQNKPNHSHDHKPRHGGVVVEAKAMDVELVAKNDNISLYLSDHGKPMDVSKSSAKVTLLTGTEKQEVQLNAVGTKLEAKGSFNLAPGTKAVAQITHGGKATTVRFVLK